MPSLVICTSQKVHQTYTAWNFCNITKFAKLSQYLLLLPARNYLYSRLLLNAFLEIHISWFQVYSRLIHYRIHNNYRNDPLRSPTCSSVFLNDVVPFEP